MALQEHVTVPDAVRPRLYVAFELSAKTCRLASSDGGCRIREKPLPSGDKQALEDELAAARKRFGLDDLAGRRPAQSSDHAGKTRCRMIDDRLRGRAEGGKFTTGGACLAA